MHCRFNSFPAIPGLILSFSLLVTLVLLLSGPALAQPENEPCLDPKWKIPKGTYIESFCKDPDTRKNCISETLDYDPGSDILSIHYNRNQFHYNLKVKSPCHYVEAGFNIHPMIINDDEEPEILLYADVSNSDKHLAFSWDKDELTTLTLYPLLKEGSIRKTCNLKYYPGSDFLAGLCNQRDTKLPPRFVMLKSLEPLATELAAEIAAWEKSQGTGIHHYGFLIENIDGALKLRNCLDIYGDCTDNKFPVSKSQVACATRGLFSVQIGEFWFCHDQQYSKKRIRIAGCKKKKLAVDPEQGLLIAQCANERIQYLPDAGTCLKAGLKLSRVRDEGELLGCELAKATGTRLSSDHQSQGENEREADHGDSAENLTATDQGIIPGKDKLNDEL